ncbi:hypothetical protein AKJ09_06263 [Labilithrix luteola]|uniref:Uncharacterized protein n=1 Tax=Labilithrix luteola TaxID=1391654 RepID=A0A0K1Q2I7_9BACT|nr:hypothetical protein AKJ09_06263 [Labilithrix luteola]
MSTTSARDAERPTQRGVTMNPFDRNRRATGRALDPFAK